MPLTARLGDKLLDATIDDLGLVGQGIVWSDVYRQRPPAVLACRACDGPMSAKMSKLGMRFFAHRRRSEYCSAAGETAIHLELKALIAARGRAQGCMVEVEAPGDGWRADVLTTRRDGQPIAWEVQRSPMAPDDVAERLARHRVSGMITVWLAKKDWQWCTGAGALIVPDKRIADEPWVVEHGVCGWRPVEDLVGYGAEWLPRQCGLTVTIDLILRDELTLELTRARDEWRMTEKLRWVPRRALEAWAASCGPMPPALPASLQLLEESCYRCGRPTAAVVGIQPLNPVTGQNYEPISAQHEGVLARICDEMIGRIKPSPALPIGVIKERYSKALGRKYMSNGCYWCDALLGNKFLYGLGARHSNLSCEDKIVGRDPRLIIGPVRVDRLRKMCRQARSIDGSATRQRFVSWVPENSDDAT
ncbi:competence protein CoiA-like protein [Kribbella rubisoli]|uniref:Competence protein CoiA-like protein n=1 Tax=Kribbella rubisoli TaxID=3075929 RepID=A0A4Q7WU93_9ACTN|nr:competence protein CoiA family protein [Kribbella rubisoli]RZU13977.1 competence protein CoiA-like protein [Kribbella rubisoli]